VTPIPVSLPGADLPGASSAWRVMKRGIHPDGDLLDFTGALVDEGARRHLGRRTNRPAGSLYLT